MKKYLSLIFLIFLLPLSVNADDHSPQMIADAWVMIPKAGHEDKFTENFKKYVAYRKANGEKRNWDVYLAVTGDELNHYIVRSYC